MRCASANDIKLRHDRIGASDLPREGTYVREVYDLFHSHKGIPIRFIAPRPARTVLTKLSDFYGMDVRRIRNGVYVFAGEWFGKVYIDYIAERLKVERLK